MGRNGWLARYPPRGLDRGDAAHSERNAILAHSQANALFYTLRAFPRARRK